MGGFYLDLDAPKKKPKEDKPIPKGDVNEEIRRKGFAKIKSETLGMDVYWVKDEYVQKRLPKNAITFTLEELKQLKGISREELVDYTVKKIFNAKEVDNFLKNF